MDRLLVLAWLGIAVATNACTGLDRGTLSVPCGDLVLMMSARSAEPARIPLEDASKAGLDKLNELNPTVGGLTLTSACRAPALLGIRDLRGDLVYSSTEPDDSWVIEYRGPSQNGYLHVGALVVLSAETGIVSSAQVFQSN